MLDWLLWLLKPKRAQRSPGNGQDMKADVAALPRVDAVQVPSPEAAPAPPEYKPTPKELAIMSLIKAAQAVDERCDTRNLHRLHRALGDFHEIVVLGHVPEPKGA